jgi:adenylate cyclase
MLGHVQEGIAQMCRGIALDHAANVGIYLSGALGFLAEARAIAGLPEEGLATLDEALALVNETNERYCEAELDRLRAEMLLMLGDEDEAEASFQEAIEVARRQQAKSWELRATMSLCRLWQKQGRKDEARRMLTDVYGWFTEGFDTPDLLMAEALLGELA